MLLSVLIRNLNEEKNLQQTLLALQKQQTNFEYEIVVIDNESDDNSVQIAERMNCKVFPLERSKFTFGHAMNYGISKCSGEFILTLSSHVILLNEFFLEKIPAYFKDASVAAIRFVLATLPAQVAESIQHGAKRLEFNADAGFAANNWTNFIVNHCSAIRRSCWEIQKFNEQIFSSEDKLWSLDILKKNYSLLYNVPCFYVYSKEVIRENKINKQVIDIAAKEIITDQKDRFFSASLSAFHFKNILLRLQQMRVQLVIRQQVYKRLKNYKKSIRNKMANYKI